MTYTTCSSHIQYRGGSRTLKKVVMHSAVTPKLFNLFLKLINSSLGSCYRKLGGGSGGKNPKYQVV